MLTDTESEYTQVLHGYDVNYEGEFYDTTRKEVGLLGGRVAFVDCRTSLILVTVAFQQRDDLEEYLRWYYEEGGLPLKDIEHEIRTIGLLRADLHPSSENPRAND